MVFIMTVIVTISKVLMRELIYHIATSLVPLHFTSLILIFIGRHLLGILLRGIAPFRQCSQPLSNSELEISFWNLQRLWQLLGPSLLLLMVAMKVLGCHLTGPYSLYCQRIFQNFLFFIAVHLSETLSKLSVASGTSSENIWMLLMNSLMGLTSLCSLRHGFPASIAMT